MLLLPQSSGDEACRVGTAILNQALIDLQHFTPEFITRARERIGTAISSKQKMRRMEAWALATDERHDICEWVGSTDFLTVVDWAGMDASKVAKVFTDLLEPHGKPDKRKKRAKNYVQSKRLNTTTRGHLRPRSAAPA